jgi:uncharacterized membrane protein YfcA
LDRLHRALQVYLNKGVWLIAGYIIGLVSAIVGIGGGTMTTPFLTYNKVDIKNAIATLFKDCK